MPEIRPVVGLMCRPKVLPLIDQVYGGTPPVAVIWTCTRSRSAGCRVPGLDTTMADVVVAPAGATTIVPVRISAARRVPSQRAAREIVMALTIHHGGRRGNRRFGRVR